MRLIFLLLFCTSFLGFSQKLLPIDSLKAKDAKDIYLDDYNNIYIYQNKNFSLVKYDSLGNQLAQLMLPRPYKIQSINNPLNIVLFSDNIQEIKLIDQNLNDIQKINLANFGFIKAAYLEDLQSLWLIDDSSKSLIQYNSRIDKNIHQFPFFANTENIVDFIVYANKVYLLQENLFSVYDLKSNLLFSQIIESPKKLKRENDYINIFTTQSFYQYSFPNQWTSKNLENDAGIVDKNQSGFLVRKQNKLYICGL